MAEIDAPAKVNLFLDILRRRADGYHDLHTVFLAIDLADRVELVPCGEEPRPGGAPLLREVVVSGPQGKGVPAGGGNLAARALVLFEEATGRRLPSLRLRLHKEIPSGAGLGGGSSDAAASLLLANALLGHPLEREALEGLAARLGSDCPFFLLGGAAEATGRGEALAPFPARDLALLLILPAFSIATPAAYARLDPRALGPRSDVEGLRRWMRGESAVLPALHNHFEEALDPLHPELPWIRRFLLEHGALFARLSGSGSATFGVFPDAGSRDEALRHVPDPWRALAANAHRAESAGGGGKSPWHPPGER